MTPSDHRIPPELRDTAEMLERERPQLGGLELDRIKRTVIARAPRTTSRKGSFMRSRLAIVTTIAVGLFMSGSGAALGISSLTSTDDASVAQYGKPGDVPRGPKPKKPKQEVLGEAEEGPGGREDRAPVTQRTRQVGTTPAAGLPFTGYASIPILLLGLALLSTGLVLRRSTRSGDDRS